MKSIDSPISHHLQYLFQFGKNWYSASRQECIQILKCYLLAGCACFGVFGAPEVLRRASVRELVYRIFITIKPFD